MPTTTERDEEEKSCCSVLSAITATLDSQFQWTKLKFRQILWTEIMCTSIYPRLLYFLVKKQRGGASFLTFEFSQINSESDKNKGKLHSGHLSDWCLQKSSTTFHFISKYMSESWLYYPVLNPVFSELNSEFATP